MLSLRLPVARLVAAIAKSRLAHFCAIGALLFAAAPRDRDRRVDVPSATLRALATADAQRSGATRAREVEARAIEDEILYREALRMSLDKGDPIVRQRLIEKLLLLIEDLGGASRAPTDAELRRYFDETQAGHRREARIHFVHVFASTKSALPPEDALDSAAREAPALGQAFPYPREVTATPAEIARLYGPDVVELLERRDAGWSEPVASPFGWHRVRVVDRVAGGPAHYEDVKKEIELDFLLARREKIVGQYLLNLASHYDIRVDGERVRDFIPPRRIAIRADPSAED